MTPSPHDRAAQPTHHLSDEALLEYTAGTATAPASLAMACHVSMCAACAAAVAALEAVGGTLLDTSAGAELAPGALEAALARLDAPPEARREAAVVPAAPPGLASLGLPGPLCRRLAETPAGADWKFVIPGVRAIDLPSGAPGATARLMSFKGGVKIPLHDHGGPEHVVVFTGALDEQGTRYARGDITIHTSGDRHEQQVLPGEPCIALVVNEGKLQPLTLRGRLLLALARG